MSTQKSITASIIQGSSIGPVSYVINAGDLEVRTLGNKLCKFANDTYLIIPADNADSRSAEINNIETWARTNKLTLNRTNSKEIVVVDTKRKRQVVSYPSLHGIAQSRDSRLSRFSASSLPMVCRRPIMFVVSSPTARKLSMH